MKLTKCGDCLRNWMVHSVVLLSVNLSKRWNRTDNFLRQVVDIYTQNHRRKKHIFTRCRPPTNCIGFIDLLSLKNRSIYRIIGSRIIHDVQQRYMWKKSCWLKKKIVANRWKNNIFWCIMRWTMNVLGVGKKACKNNIMKSSNSLFSKHFMFLVMTCIHPQNNEIIIKLT